MGETHIKTGPSQFSSRNSFRKCSKIYMLCDFTFLKLFNIVNNLNDHDMHFICIKSLLQTSIYNSKGSTTKCLREILYGSLVNKKWSKNNQMNLNL